MYGQITCRADVTLDVHSGHLLELFYLTPSFIGRKATLTYAPR